MGRAITPGDVAGRLEQVRSRLDAAGAAPTIVAVTKAFGPDAVEAAAAVGLTDIGENYAQECMGKLAEVAGPIPRVHFIGRLQRNKIRKLAPLVSVWQSVDRIEVADEIAKRAPGAHILVQVDLSGEPEKGGVTSADARALVDHATDAGLVVDGLMGVGPRGPAEAARPGFRSLRRLVDELGLHECSMGMSADLEIALAEGSTMVRIGRDLFGPRPG